MKLGVASNVEHGRQMMDALVRAFHGNLARYQSPDFNEASARQDFIDPFWRCLGWPLGGQSELIPEERDVRIETLLDGRHPDYQFQPAGQVRFFCEAKKPSENLGTNRSHIFQAKSYAWSWAQMGQRSPLCVLTDFEEFRFFTAHRRPRLRRPSAGLVREFDLKYLEYVEKFDRLWEVFSRDAVAAGSLSEFLDAGDDAGEPLDEAFLNDLLLWRGELAVGLLAGNSDLAEHELNESVQRILDRLVFLRMAEDRGTEVNPVIAPLEQAKDPWASFNQTCRRMAPRYNGLLFRRHFSEELALEPQLFRTVLTELLPEVSPFRFNVIEVELLGRIYEAFLGCTIKIRPDGSCDVDRKPSVLKAGGVYYTPRPVVEWIVKRTLDPQVKGRTPTQLAGLRVLDPSCGSGSFLLAAYQYLLDYHRAWYRAREGQVTKPRSKYRDDVRMGPEGLEVSVAKRAQILRSNIYGVDIDLGAVEVAAMSLYLKLLEGSSRTQRQLFLILKGAILPDLSSNLKCGNSLIGPEILDALDLSEAEVRRINPLDWAMEFPENFDAIVGNPPYVKEYENRQIFLDLRHSRNKHHYTGKMDIWYAFACQGLEHLKPGGRHGFITQNNWVSSHGAKPFRAKIRESRRIEELMDFHEYMVFRNAGIQTMIYLVRSEAPEEPYEVLYRRLDRRALEPGELSSILAADSHVDVTRHRIRVDPAAGDRNLRLTPVPLLSILDTMEAAGAVKIEKSEVGQGIIGGPDQAFLHKGPKALFTEAEQELLHPYYTSATRFGGASSQRLVAYLTPATCPRLSPELHPNLRKQLVPFRDRLEGRRETKKGRMKWFHLHWPRREDLFAAGPKLACPTRVERPAFTVIEEEYYASRAVNMLVTDRIDLYYLAGVFNSAPVHFWLMHCGKRLGKMLQIDTAVLLGIPIPSPRTRSNRPLAREMIAAVKERQAYGQRFRTARSDRDREQARRRGVATEVRIDVLAAELFGLDAAQRTTIADELGEAGFPPYRK